MQQPVFLVGYMCSGKTTLGKALSRRLQVDFIDLDEYIEQSQRRTISEIFAQDGEAGFRRVEAAALDTLIDAYSNRRVIIALGGGTPCRPGVMERLNESGLTVHLAAPVDRLVERLIVGAAKRPLVAGKTPGEITNLVERMLADRNPYYTLARVSFDASQLETAEEIEQTTTKFIKEIFA